MILRVVRHRDPAQDRDRVAIRLERRESSDAARSKVELAVRTNRIEVLPRHAVRNEKDEQARRPRCGLCARDALQSQERRAQPEAKRAQHRTPVQGGLY